MGTAQTWIAVALAGGLAMVGCDKKEAEKATGTATKAVGDAGKSAGDTLKKAGDAVKDTGAKAADAVKDAGAKAADTGKAAVDKAKAAVSDEAKKAFDGYVGEVDKAGGLLAKITSLDTAKSSLADLGKSVASLNAASGLVDKLPADVKAALMGGEGKGGLDKAVGAFKAQVDRIGKDTMLNGVLGSTLKQFKLVG